MQNINVKKPFDKWNDIKKSTDGKPDTFGVHVRTVSTKRFLRKIGMISKGDFEKIQQRIMQIIRANENPLLSGPSRRPKP